MGAFDDIIAKYSGPTIGSQPAAPATLTFQQIATRDPHLLDPAVRGKPVYQDDAGNVVSGEGHIPASQNQFYGQQLKPQEGVFTKIIRMFNNDPSIGPVALEAPIGAGLVMSAKNAGVILDQMKAIGASSDLPAAENAVKYIMAKYPKLAALPEEIKVVDPSKFGPGASGAYDPVSKTAYVSNSIFDSFGDKVKAVAHELVHAGQDARGQSFYVPAASQGMSEYEQYASHPAEAAAMQGGDTALNTFRNFMQIVGKKAP